MKKTQFSKVTDHHVRPRSRGGGNEKRNIARVIHGKHDPYHQLFGNMLPEEIVDYLNETFWNSNYKISILEKKP